MSHYLLKMIVVGESSVGKTSLCSKLVNSELTISHIQPTIGVEYSVTYVRFGDKSAKCQLWDLSGSPLFRDIVKSYYRGSIAAMVVFDLSRPETLIATRYWIDEVTREQEGERVSQRILLVGNKDDLKRNVTPVMIGSVLSDYPGVVYIETSSKESKTIPGFEEFVKGLVRDYEDHGYHPGAIRDDPYRSLDDVDKSKYKSKYVCKRKCDMESVPCPCKVS